MDPKQNKNRGNPPQQQGPASTRSYLPAHQYGGPVGGALNYGSNTQYYSLGDSHNPAQPNRGLYPYANATYQPPQTAQMLDNIKDETDPTKRFLMISNLKFDKSYKYPSNLTVAAEHQNANRLGKNAIELVLGGNGSRNVKICPCCDNLVIAEQFSICHPTYYQKIEEGQQKENEKKEKNQLPMGIVMYFCFIKMVIAFLLLRFLVYDIYTLIVSNYGSYCSNYQLSHTTNLCFTVVSAYNLKASADQGQLNVLDILTLIFTLLAIALFITFRKIINYQRNLFSPFPFFYDSQYSILIEDIPPFLYNQNTDHKQVNYQYQNELEKILAQKIGDWLRYIDQNRNSQKLTYLQKECLQNVIKANESTIDQLTKQSIAMVTVCYDLTELENIIKMREELLTQYSKTDPTTLSSEDRRLLKHIPNQIRHLNQEYIRLCQHFVQDQNQVYGFKLAHFTGKAFISFEYEHYRDYFISQYQSDSSFLTISGKPIKISYANKPNDVKWYNMKVKDSERRKNIFYTSAVLVMMLILSFASLFFIQRWQNSQQIIMKTNQNSLIGEYAIVAAQSLLVFVINYILAIALDLLSVYQKHKTESDRQLSLNIKTVITQALNTVGTYAILYLIDPINPLSQFGLVSKILNLVVVAGAVNIFNCAVLPVQMLTWCWNRCKYREDQSIHLFQIELNRKVQYSPYNFTDAYAYYIIYTFVVSFYGYMVPLATPALIFFYVLQYWLDKFNLFKRFSSPMDFSNHYTELMVSLFEVSIVFFAVGHFLWDSSVHFDANAGFKVMNILSIVLAVVYVCLFMFSTESFRKKILRNYTRTGYFSYSDYAAFQVNKFTKRFKTENPATSCFKDIDTISNYISDRRSLNQNTFVQGQAQAQVQNYATSYQPGYQRRQIQQRRIEEVKEQLREQTPTEVLLDNISFIDRQISMLENQIQRLEDEIENSMFEKNYFEELYRDWEAKIQPEIIKKGSQYDQSSIARKREILLVKLQQMDFRINSIKQQIYYRQRQIMMRKQKANMLQCKLEQQQASITPVQKEVIKRSNAMTIRQRQEKKSKKQLLKEAWLQNEAKIIQQNHLDAPVFVGEQQIEKQPEIHSKQISEQQEPAMRKDYPAYQALNQFNKMYNQSYKPVN